MNRFTENLKDPDYFVVGLQKCGTFWLTALLDAHPEIRCLPTHARHNLSKGKTGADEGRIFDVLATLDDDGGTILKDSFTNYHGGFFKNIVPLMGKVSREELDEIVKKRYREWFQFHNSARKPIVGDKTTEYVFHLSTIDDWFLSAKKICIFREPKDRVVSWHTHQIRRGRLEENSKITDEFVESYVQDRIVPEYDALLRYGKYIFCLTYESLHEKPFETLNNLFVFLGAKKKPKKFIEAILRQASMDNLRRQDDSEDFVRRGHSHYNKGRIGEWKNRLTARQVEVVDETIGHLQQKVFSKHNCE